MSATSTSTMEHTGNAPWTRCGARRGNWTTFNIATMVLGFVFFWPVGLFLVYWIVSGRDVRELPQVIREQWSRLSGRTSGFGGGFSKGASGNSVFEDYQRTQYDRIREIKEEISERSRRFAQFRGDAMRRKEEEEFQRFMASAPERKDA